MHRPWCLLCARWASRGRGASRRLIAELYGCYSTGNEPMAMRSAYNPFGAAARRFFENAKRCQAFTAHEAGKMRRTKASGPC